MHVGRAMHCPGERLLLALIEHGASITVVFIKKHPPEAPHQLLRIVTGGAYRIGPRLAPWCWQCCHDVAVTLSDTTAAPAPIHRDVREGSHLRPAAEPRGCLFIELDRKSSTHPENDAIDPKQTWWRPFPLMRQCPAMAQEQFSLPLCSSPVRAARAIHARFTPGVPNCCCCRGQLPAPPWGIKSRTPPCRLPKTIPSTSTTPPQTG